ncbi:RNA polymerase factor sigma-54 [Mechercharimyces sp. CAU 1602]|uniref:RNA polymerase factor sigma-54 n=1 Tax=Mechercharimyces sp. CAU 1602 TaxID=2973933 RepID=UPI002163F841|nr:RNA polymerase factor sigma-54 [Mechercharimyces sp. CAU 1602]
MEFGFNQEQKLSVTMTPQLRQALHILQLPAYELLTFLQEKIIENPLLESEEQITPTEREMEAWAKLQSERGTASVHIGNEKEHVLERLSSAGDTLMVALEAQLRELTLTAYEYKVCLYLAGNLDEKGYLQVEDEAICKRFHLSRDEYENCITIVQSLDPAGVGARSLAECLELQLLRQNKGEEAREVALAIVKDHLHDLAAHRLKKIATALSVKLLCVQRALDLILKLDPRPGAVYVSEPARYLLPDVIVDWQEGAYEVSIHDPYIPRLRLSPYYHQLMHRKDEGEGAAQATRYLEKRFQAAKWLIKNVEQRRLTMYRVSDCIVRRQRDFFENGKGLIKPLTLQQVADELSLHESTVSRATQHKYMQTPYGIFPFRFFFQTKVTTHVGENTSTYQVKRLINTLIVEEDKEKPLSDQKISQVLMERGIRISRRTVAKYREEMKIAASTHRRRYV